MAATSDGMTPVLGDGTGDPTNLASPDTGSAYSGGSAATAGGSAGMGFNGNRGLSADGGTMNFAGESSGGVNPIGSDDPQDYFTRLGLGENLFKIITRKYRAKATDWARVTAETAVKSVNAKTR